MGLLGLNNDDLLVLLGFGALVVYFQTDYLAAKSSENVTNTVREVYHDSKEVVKDASNAVQSVAASAASNAPQALENTFNTLPAVASFNFLKESFADAAPFRESFNAVKQEAAKIPVVADTYRIVKHATPTTIVKTAAFPVVAPIVEPYKLLKNNKPALEYAWNALPPVAAYNVLSSPRVQKAAWDALPPVAAYNLVSNQKVQKAAWDALPPVAAYNLVKQIGWFK